MKLVRDLIPVLYPQHTYRLAGPWEMESLLLLKIVEEAGELHAATSKDELEEELADLMEAVEALVYLRRISLEGTVRQVQDRKRIARGGFTRGWVLL